MLQLKKFIETSHLQVVSVIAHVKVIITQNGIYLYYGANIFCELPELPNVISHRGSTRGVNFHILNKRRENPRITFSHSFKSWENGWIGRQEWKEAI